MRSRIQTANVTKGDAEVQLQQQDHEFDFSNLPDAAAARALEEIVPGTSKRVVDVWFSEIEHRRAIEMKYVDSEVLDVRDTLVRRYRQ